MTMTLFIDAATQLTADDIDYIHQHTPEESSVSAGDASAESTDHANRRATGRRQGKDSSEKMSSGASSGKTPSPSKEGNGDGTANLPAAEPTGQENGDSAIPEAGQPTDQSTPANEADGQGLKRRRRRVAHVWPELGTELTATHFGTAYTAEIVGAHKKLKSGRQILLTNGPGKGTICDSLSEAMLKATEAQRDQQKLGRKSASNGWDFWTWDGKAS